MTFSAYLDDQDKDVRVTFDIDPMADAIGCPPELRGAYAGQYNVELHRCVAARSGVEVELSARELEWLKDMALKLYLEADEYREVFKNDYEEVYHGLHGADLAAFKADMDKMAIEEAKAESMAAFEAGELAEARQIMDNEPPCEPPV